MFYLWNYMNFTWYYMFINGLQRIYILNYMHDDIFDYIQVYII
jgi:hypothetical protein